MSVATNTKVVLPETKKHRKEWKWREGRNEQKGDKKWNIVLQFYFYAPNYASNIDPASF